MTNPEQPDTSAPCRVDGLLALHLLQETDVVRVAVFAYYLQYLEGALNDIGATLALVDDSVEWAPDAEMAVVVDVRPIAAIVRRKNFYAWLDFALLVGLAVSFVAFRATGYDLAAGLCGGLGIFVAIDLTRRFHEIGHQRKLAHLIADKEREVGWKRDGD